ncbi:MAG: amidohydrolase [Acidimicrobiia bacterium]|nr:amidohydrolase [Acidimicrobiia bacterium]
MIRREVLRETVAVHREELVAFRRHLHAHPELSWQEHETTRDVAQRLAVMGLDPVTLDGGVGVICDMPGSRAGRTVVLRADLDALPIQDAKDVPYRSLVDGVSHACGHDVHTSIVLGTALTLRHLTTHAGLELPGTVRFVFQPAEESIESGAQRMIESGALDDATAIYALHCDPRLAVGRVGLKAGAITSAFDALTIRLTGPGGHTARPWMTADLVTIAARVAVDLPAGLARLLDMRGGVNLTFGRIAAGDAPNVIPSHAELRGTLRAIDRDVWTDAPATVKRLLEAIVSPYGADWDLDYMRGSPPTDNDPKATAVVAEAARAVLGPDAVADTEQSLGGEDFSWYLERVPGCYIRLGVRTDGDSSPPRDLHADTFDVDEACIDVGVALLTQVALDTLAMD